MGYCKYRTGPSVRDTPRGCQLGVARCSGLLVLGSRLPGGRMGQAHLASQAPAPAGQIDRNRFSHELRVSVTSFFLIYCFCILRQKPSFLEGFGSAGAGGPTGSPWRSRPSRIRSGRCRTSRTGLPPPRPPGRAGKDEKDREK